MLLFAPPNPAFKMCKQRNQIIWQWLTLLNFVVLLLISSVADATTLFASPYGLAQGRLLTQHSKLYSNNPQRQQHQQQQQQQINEKEIVTINKEPSRGLYVHIPYCRRRCNYCDFAIVPIGSSINNDSQTSVNAGFQKMDRDYKKAILDEIKLIGASSSSASTAASSSLSESSQVETKKKIPLRSIYFGGGTPSLAPISTLRDIMFALLYLDDAPFYLDDDIDNADGNGAEITIEMDPGTFNLTFLEAIKDMGFNRISLGVQSFDDDILASMGRVHRSADVYRSIELINTVYGEEKANYSIDLISGVPGLTLAGWTETLYEAVRLQPRPLHISLYDLQVEKGTAFGKWYKDGREEDESMVSRRGATTNSKERPFLPSSEDCAFMYRYASGYLRSKKYEHYEISSYGYVGPNRTHRSKHNQIYWEIGGEWYAIGLGATSKVNGVRFARPRALSDYITWSKNLNQNFEKVSASKTIDDAWAPPWLTGAAETDEELADQNEDILDIIMTRLRTSDGLDLDVMNKSYGESYVEAILRGFELALDLDLGVKIPSATGKYGVIRLNDPSGFLFSNNILSNVFVELDEV